MQVFGLIESNWGGTIVEAWMPQGPLDLCGIEPHDNGDESNPNRNSVLYNAMIHPLIRLSIKGALWYQGKKIQAIPVHFLLFKLFLEFFKFFSKVRPTVVTIGTYTNAHFPR